MFRLSAGFIVGVCLLLATPAIPPLMALVALSVVILPFRAPLFLGMALGALWAASAAERELDRWLPGDQGPIVVLAEARVADIPELRGRGVRLTLQLLDTDPALPARRAQVYWPDPDVMPRAGDTWLLSLRLNRPTGFRNETGFDRERWALTGRIHARGQVLSEPNPRRVETAGGPQALRQHLAEGIRGAIADPAARGLAVALVVGDRQDLAPELWQQLVATGTNHLVAISGLHVSLLAGAVWLLASAAWRCSPWLCRRYPARLAGAWPAILSALGYAMLAGFALPTQRALLMFAVLALLMLRRRSVAPGQALLVAVVCILLLDPLAPVSATFWLSSLAVGVLVIAALGAAARQPVAVWTRAQFALLVGLLPLTVYWFGQVAWVAPLANLFAVPLVGALVVPVLLSGALLWPVSGELATFCWEWGGWLLQGFDSLVGGLASHAALYQSPSTGAPLLAAIGAVGAGLILAPRGFPGRRLAPLLLLPLLLPVSSALPTGRALIDLHDVGHGQALHIRTRYHTLILDSGPANPGRDLVSGKGAALLAYSRERAGYRGAYDAMKIDPTHLCDLPQAWTWDEVAFRTERTAAGCLLLIEAGGERLLVLSGLERPVVSELLSLGLPRVRYLVAAAHGHEAFHPPALLEHLAPTHVLVSVNARNRWALPHETFTARLAESDARIWVTGCHGQLRVVLGTEGGIETPARNQYWWRRIPPAECLASADP